MDIRHLREILAIRDHGSFAKAAEALNIAQPALSKSIAKIEDELNLTIFTRTSTGSELTPMGEMIAERAERVMAATRTLAREAALVAGGDAGTVRLGVGTLLKDTLLPALMLRIAEAHPHLGIQVEFGAGHRLLPLVHSRELDMALCTADAPRGPLAYVEALRADLIFVARPDHPLADERCISVDRLAQFPCAGPSIPGFTVSALLKQRSEAARLDAYMANDLDALMPLVRAGHAVLFTPPFFVEDALRSGELARLDVQWAGEVEYGCYTTQAATLSPILAEITRYAVEIGGSMQQTAWDQLS